MRQTTQWETIRKVLRYIRRYRIYFVASILLASVNVFGTSRFVYCYVRRLSSVERL